MLSAFSTLGLCGRGSREDMLDVSVDANDGFPEHVFEKCKCRLERLEKAAEDLESFRAQVRASYASLHLKRSELKRRTPVL